MGIDPQRQRPILGGKTNFPLCMAPMVGLSHVAVRRLVREYLPQGSITIWPTEMLNSRRVPAENLSKTPETARHESESEMVPQLLGNEEQPIAKSVRRLQEEWGAEGIDINMGCPVKKALSHNYGVALMGDPDYAADIVRMTVANTELPVSVKLRAMESGEVADLERFVGGLVKAGASWLTLHPRRPGQQRRGSADWQQIRQIRESIDVALIGNGDVQTADDAERMLAETGCDAVMIGRALTARPWLLWQFGERRGLPPPPGRDGEKAPRTPEEEGREAGRALVRLAQLMAEHYPGDLGLRKFRFFVRTASPWLQFGHDLYARSTQAREFSELQDHLAQFFSQPQLMTAKTELRQ